MTPLWQGNERFRRRLGDGYDRPCESAVIIGSALPSLRNDHRPTAEISIGAIQSDALMEKKRRRGRSLRCCCFFFRFLRTPLHDATSVESVRRTTKLPGPFIVVVSGRKHNSVEQINAFSQRRLSTFHSVAMAFTGFLWLLPSFTWFFLLSVRVCVYWALRRLPGTGYNLFFKRIIRFVPSFNGFDSVYYLVCF